MLHGTLYFIKMIIKNFQIQHDLYIDGIIGKNTVAKMGEVFGIYHNNLAHFLGQFHHETAGFTKHTESLNYAVSGLQATFSYYRNRPKEAQEDGRTWYKKADQETIANKVYWDKNRSASYRLGNENWGDGWKYRGRGFQLTGKWNYDGFSEEYGVDVVNNPEMVASTWFWESGLWFFRKKNIFRETGTITIAGITAVTKRVNGGTNGLEERIKWTRYYETLIDN